ncbi:MAG: hypothetical protein ABI397_01420 [Candidatus Saccharimonas sp.]
MATAKKRTTTKPASSKKKPSTRSASTTKRVVSRKPSTRARAVAAVKRVRKTSAKRSSSTKSFHRAAPDRPFFSLQPNIQTVYWIILAVPVIALGLWVSNISMQVQSLYDQIDAANAASSVMSIPKHVDTPVEK